MAAHEGRSSSPLALVALVTIAMVGCKSAKLGEPGSTCAKKADCAAGLRCLDGVCTKLEDEGPPAEPQAHCEGLAKLAGEWIFDTTVVGAESLVWRGINGHFAMRVEVDPVGRDGECPARAEIRKLGHDDVEYSEDKIPVSQAPLVVSERIPGAFETTVSLKDGPSHTFHFVAVEGQLFGYYRAAGEEWERTGISGFVRGVPKDQDLAGVDEFAVQPCEVGCHIHCDVARREADQTLDEPGLAACMTACEAGEKTVGCGPGKDPHPSMVVEVHGPVPKFGQICKQASAQTRLAHDFTGKVRCDDEPLVKGKAKARRYASKHQFKGSFLAAQILQIGYVDEGYTGHLALALETDGGWYWTGPLVDLSAAPASGVTAETEQLRVRFLDLLPAPGREFVVEVDVQVTDADLADNEVAIDETERLVVCATGAPPTCLRLATEWSSRRTLIDRKPGDDPKDHPSLHDDSGELYPAFLPGGRLSVSAPLGSRTLDRELSAIYAWP